MNNRPSQQFMDAINNAEARAQQAPDDSIRYMTRNIPVFALKHPTPEMQKAAQRSAGCTACVVLGLWVKEWPGYPPNCHGTIFLYEDGITMAGAIPGAASNSLEDKTYSVLVHEFGHALQRDHVLDTMEQIKAATRGFQVPVKPCGCGK